MGEGGSVERVVDFAVESVAGMRVDVDVHTYSHGLDKTQESRV